MKNLPRVLLKRQKGASAKNSAMEMKNLPRVLLKRQESASAKNSAMEKMKSLPSHGRFLAMSWP